MKITNSKFQQSTRFSTAVGSTHLCMNVCVWKSDDELKLKRNVSFENCGRLNCSVGKRIHFERAAIIGGKSTRQKRNNNQVQHSIGFAKIVPQVALDSVSLNNSGIIKHEEQKEMKQVILATNFDEIKYIYFYFWVCSLMLDARCSLLTFFFSSHHQATLCMCFLFLFLFSFIHIVFLRNFLRLSLTMWLCLSFSKRPQSIIRIVESTDSIYM